MFDYVSACICVKAIQQFCCFCFHVGVDKVFVFVIRSPCFRYLLKSIEFVSYSYPIFIANISIVN